MEPGQPMRPGPGDPPESGASGRGDGRGPGAASGSGLPEDAELASATVDPAGTRGPRALFSDAARELVILVAIALVISILLRAFIVQAFFIPSASMENTLLTNDRVLV